MVRKARLIPIVGYLPLAKSDAKWAALEKQAEDVAQKMMQEASGFTNGMGAGTALVTGVVRGVVRYYLTKAKGSQRRSAELFGFERQGFKRLMDRLGVCKPELGA